MKSSLVIGQGVTWSEFLWEDVCGRMFVRGWLSEDVYDLILKKYSEHSLELHIIIY